MLVFSKVPLLDYRRDLDELHGSTQNKMLYINVLEVVYIISIRAIIFADILLIEL